MGSQQQPVVVDSSASSPQSGAWASGATVFTSAVQVWKAGDVVYAAIANISNLTVSSVANGGAGLGTTGTPWAKVADATPTNAVASSTTALELELWCCLATADGSGVITATMSGTAAAGTEILTFALYGTQITADKVAVANTAAAVVAIPAATTVFGDAQAMTIFATKASSNTPTAQANYSLLGNISSSGNVLISATLAAAYTTTAGTAVTPPVTNATQTSGSPSVAITVMLKPPVPPPTGLTATYTAGVGISLAWTAPAGYTGTGYNVYRTTGAAGNGVPQRLDPTPGAPVPWGTVAFIDRIQGYTPVQSGDNVCTYYVTTLAATGATGESPASPTATATWLG